MWRRPGEASRREYVVKMLNKAAGGADPAQSSSAAADYIASLSGELALLARQHGLECLGYILDMAQLEANQIAKSSVESNRLA